MSSPLRLKPNIAHRKMKTLLSLSLVAKILLLCQALISVPSHRVISSNISRAGRIYGREPDKGTCLSSNYKLSHQVYGMCNLFVPRRSGYGLILPYNSLVCLFIWQNPVILRTSKRNITEKAVFQKKNEQQGVNHCR